MKAEKKIGAVGLKTLIAYYDAASNGKMEFYFVCCPFMFVVAQGIRTVDDVFLAYGLGFNNQNLFFYAVFAALTFLFM